MKIKNALFKFIDATIGNILCRLTGIYDFIFRQNTKQNIIIPQPETIKNILVIRPGGMGDMIMLLPVLKSLTDVYKNAQITIICEHRNLDILKLAAIKCEIIPYDKNTISFLYKLRRKKYDIAIDTEQFHNFSSLFAYWSRASVRIGFKINPLRNNLYTHMINYAPDENETCQFSLLLQPLNIPLPSNITSPITPLPLPTMITPIDFQEMLKGNVCIFHPGTTSEYKLWPLAEYVELAKLLKNEFDFSFIITGSKNDLKIVSQLHNMLLSNEIRTTNIAGKTNLLQLFFLISNACLFVGIDSGIAHLATVTNTPSVIIFGPSDSLKWGTHDKIHTCITSEMPCAPCFIFGYHKLCKHPECMVSIKAEEVFIACKKVLANKKILPSTDSKNE